MTVNTEPNNGSTMSDIANDLVAKAKELVSKGNARKIVIVDKSDRTWVNMTLTMFAALSFILFVIFDWLFVILAFIAALIFRPTVSVSRLNEDASEEASDEVKVKVAVEPEPESVETV